MKNLILTAVIAFAIMAGANAQHRFSPKDRIQQLKDSLALSDSQVSAIDSIFTITGNKMKDLRESGQIDREAMKKIMEENDAQIKSVLTPEQKGKYEAMLAARKNNRPPDGGTPPDGGGTPPDNGN
jgi:Spy/CpxP family protein refolding chaperone